MNTLTKMPTKAAPDIGFADLVKTIPCNKENPVHVEFNIKLYAGYANAGMRKESNLFYRLFECQKFSHKYSYNDMEISNTKTLHKLYYLTLEHQVPYYTQEIKREMIYTWMNNQPFPGYFPHYSDNIS